MSHDPCLIFIPHNTRITLNIALLDLGACCSTYTLAIRGVGGSRFSLPSTEQSLRSWQGPQGSGRERGERGSGQEARTSGLWGEAGAAPGGTVRRQQCGNGAPALLVSTSTNFPNDYG